MEINWTLAESVYFCCTSEEKPVPKVKKVTYLRGKDQYLLKVLEAMKVNFYKNRTNTEVEVKVMVVQN